MRPAFALAPLFFLFARLAIAADVAPPVKPLAPEFLARKPASLLPADLAATMTFRSDDDVKPPATAAWSSAAGGVPVLRVKSFNSPKSPDHVDVRWNVPLQRGHVMLARFYVRAISAKQESGEAMFALAVQQSQPEFARHVVVALTAGPEWTLIEVPFAAAANADASQGEFHLSFGTIPQAVEVAGIELLDFGDRATVAELPQVKLTYKGREADAPWRRDALARIERIRTAPIDVRVIDAALKPIEGATVDVRLVRPAFLFGTEVDSTYLMSGDSPAVEKYKQVLLDNFDSAVIGNGMKWPRWSGSAASRDEALRALDWCESNGLRMRGHNLVWPGDKFSPKRVQQMPAPRAELPLLIDEHIRDELTATRGRIDGWDVINEMLHERDYFKTMPEEQAAQWFKVARQSDPHAKLFLNEYGMLNGPNSPKMCADYVALYQRLRAAGAPIDAMGVQSHVGRQPRDPADVLADLDVLAAAKCELQVTEFDISTPDEALQGDYMHDFLIAIYSHPSVTGFTMWGFWQSKHWKADAGLWRADWSQKPNGKAWHELVREQWLTHVTANTNADGALPTTRGHLGDYEFTVVANGKTARERRALTIDGAHVTIQFP